jgi:hypothetical protein
MINLIINLIILFYNIYKLTGIYYIIPILICIINIIYSTFWLIINQDSYFLKFVRLASISFIIYIILIIILTTINNIYLFF